MYWLDSQKSGNLKLAMFWLVVNEMKDEKLFTTMWQIPGGVKQHIYTDRKRKSLHWQEMRHKEPNTASMQRHRNTKTAWVHFTNTHTHTLFLGLGATILKAEGLECVFLCPCQLAIHCNGWGGDTGSMSSPQCTGGGQGTSELRVHKCSYERPRRMQHPLTWSSSVHLLLLFSLNQQHSPPSIQPHSLCSVPAGSSFSVDFGHRLLTTKVWSWITNTSLSGTAAKTQAGSQKVLVPVPLHHPQSHQLAGQSSKAGKQEASGFAISDR